jgi:cytochrome c oxidase cbb3-type subunit 3
MIFQRVVPRACLLVICGIFSLGFSAAQTTAHKGQTKTSTTSSAKSYPAELVQKGSTQFQQDCSFCHGRDATGGESGPDLARSKLVAADVHGEKIGTVVRNGRLEKGMPPFDRSDDQIAALVAFIHTQRSKAMSGTGRGGEGGRKGVDAADLQTGNADAGKEYFNGAGGCSNCHSPTGDLAGIASRHQGLELEELMLYPKRAKQKVDVTLASGQTISGTLAYLDEFTVGVVDSSGVYHSWRTGDVQYKVDPPLNAHVDLFSKYTDDDIHNLMAYLQTLH